MLAELYVDQIIYITKWQKKLEKSDKIGKKRTFLSVMLIVEAKKNILSDEIRLKVIVGLTKFFCSVRRLDFGR
jgi:hypothetical protein